MNMEWQPIKTAPTDVLVRLGRWVEDYEGVKWETKIGFAWRSKRVFMFFTMRERDTFYYDFWSPLPPAPTGAA